MEPKFINQFELTQELFKELTKNPITNKGIRNQKKGICIRIIGYICSVHLIVLGIVWNELLITLLGLIFILLFLYKSFIQSNKIISKRYSDMLDSNGNKKLILKYSFADYITIELGRNRTNYAYTEIIKQTEDETYIYIYLSYDNSLRIRKDSFVVGSPDEFKEFISSVKPQ